MADSEKQSDTVLVKHNGGGLFHIGISWKEGTHGVDKITLRPGYNQVPADKWAVAETEKMVQYHLKHPKKNPMFEVEGRAKGGEYILGKFSAEEAIAVVGETADDNVLTEWQLQEKRPSVLKAIVARIEELLPPGAKN
jgi:hypothetical protein